jgi:hypothetical protein
LAKSRTKASVFGIIPKNKPKRIIMQKQDMKKALKAEKIFINEIDEAIEEEVYSNINIIIKEVNQDKEGKGIEFLKKSHTAIIEVLEIKSIEESKYFKSKTFITMVKEKIAIKEERIRVANERKAKANQSK